MGKISFSIDKKQVTEADFMLANRRAARMEEIEQHGKPVSFRKVLPKSLMANSISRPATSRTSPNR